MGMGGNGGGGFFGGMAGGLNTMQQLNHQKQLQNMFETLNQNWLGRENPNMQGPVPQMGGVSLFNRMMGGMRQMGDQLGGLF